MPTKPPTFRASGRKPRPEAERERKAILDARRPSAPERGYDAAWRKVRRQFIETHPKCCYSGCTEPTQEVHHVQTIADRPDLRLRWSNLRPLCKSHHSAITATEQGFARPQIVRRG